MSLERDGFAWVRGAFDSNAVDAMLERLNRLLLENANDASILAGSSGPAYGARNLMRLWPDAAKLIGDSPSLASAVRAALGDSAGVVRGLFFDKPPGHSWALPWHRDYTIAVKDHRPSPGFAKPTMKAGVPHLEAPEWLLKTILTVRIHLDAMADDNGPLRVVPGSHRNESEIVDDAVTLHCEGGDALLMRPLLLHASGHSLPGSANHRRIVHLECAGSRELPDGLEWNRFEPIS